ncbi:hypothetical protein EUGRSUZ_F04414 [Eucalyptus grandis]|uniref:Uncharacterized protein n=2 Tax=Eucalyptus grandis TaxID=71139 RepID=A0ACC3KQG0_EUCGR|nr:hypothetical protein EUGRSUZ_F04414 [Eucalyptus grandis]
MIQLAARFDSTTLCRKRSFAGRCLRQIYIWSYKRWPEVASQLAIIRLQERAYNRGVPSDYVCTILLGAVPEKITFDIIRDVLSSTT